MAEPKTNLISMTFRRPWGRYAQGDRAGFEPARAKQLEDRKIAVPTATVKQETSAPKKAGGATKPTGTEGADKT
uniref:hypothetical protein n=1 Tax=Halomonas sp. TaxID=1486246 RepID=UPI00261209F6|nr:hypothetical protein [Halomonas sp.]